MNQVIMSGGLVADPIMCKSKRTGRAFCKCRLVVYGDYNGKEREYAKTYIDILAFTTNARDRLYNLCRKGNWIELHGSIDSYDYLDNNGDKHRATVVVLKDFMRVRREWEKEPISRLRDADGKLIIPKEMTDEMVKTVRYGDEDIPEEFIERRLDESYVTL